jgi:hypothetical protein
MIEREPRKEPKKHREIDRMEPFNYEQLGTPDDPCFGKHFSLRAKECKKCGDCEICQIVTSQQMLTEIKQVEGKKRFKDVEEAEFVTGQNETIAKKMMARAKKKDGWCSINKLGGTLIKMFNLVEGHDEEHIRQRIIMMGEQTKGIKLNKDKTKYRYDS